MLATVAIYPATDRANIQQFNKICISAQLAVIARITSPSIMELRYVHPNLFKLGAGSYFEQVGA